MDYLYDREAGLPMLVDDETNTYLHDGGVLATIDGSDDPLYLLNDALGSVRGVTDEAGDLDGTADYAVYGEVRASSGVSTLFRFTGEQHDTETGFTYLRARYANAALGRFTSADTVQPNAPGTQGYNLYAYVANNPTTWVDPSGHEVSPTAQQLTAQVIASNGQLMRDLVYMCAAAAGAGAVLAGAAMATVPPSGGLASAGVGLAFGVCASALFVGVTVPVLVCALTPGCIEGAVAQARSIAAYGSDTFDGVTEWTWERLRDIAKRFPAEKCIRYFLDCLDEEWDTTDHTGQKRTCVDCLIFCTGGNGYWPDGWCKPGSRSKTVSLSTFLKVPQAIDPYLTVKECFNG
jgi:RHS repeat-associated protein